MQSILRKPTLTLTFCLLACFTSISARAPVCGDSTTTSQLTADEPFRIQLTGIHAIGNWVMAVSNTGLFGHDGLLYEDYFSDMTIEYASEYPKFSGVNQLRSGTFWIGGVVDRDTLVSQGFCSQLINQSALYELLPDAPPGGQIVMRSIGDPNSPGYEEAVSEQDIIAVYTDSVAMWWVGTDSEYDTPHKPLGIEVTQRSYAWSSEMANDFIMFNLTIKNISDKTIHDAYFGVVMRPQVGYNITYG